MDTLLKLLLNLSIILTSFTIGCYYQKKQISDRYLSVLPLEGDADYDYYYYIIENQPSDRLK